MRSIYHPPQVDIISKIYHPFRQGTDIIEKSPVLSNRTFFCHSCPKKNWVKTGDFLYKHIIIFAILHEDNLSWTGNNIP